MQNHIASFATDCAFYSFDLLVLLFFTRIEKLKELEEKTGYPKVYFFLAITSVLSLLITICGGTKLIVDLVGFVYPAYMSFKSMDANKGDDTQWLTYWVVFAFFSIMESLAGFLVSYQNSERDPQPKIDASGIRLANLVGNRSGYELIDWDESVASLENLPNVDMVHL